MDRKLRFLVVCGVFAVGLLVSGVVVAEEAPGDELDAPVLVVENAAPADVCLPAEEPAPLEDLDLAGNPVNVCNVPCGGIPYVNCTKVCGDAAACFNGRCLYL